MISKNEIYVGLPFLKCSSNPSQTINAKTNKKSKTAVTKKIALEAFERFGNDPDINKDESNKNIYLTKIESTEEYLELIEKTKEKINGQLVNTNKKKLRKDTVDTIALVVKPSYDSMKQLTFDEQVKFLKDSKVVIENIFCQYINPNFKFDGAIIHFDEINPHLHCLGMPTIIDETTGIETFNAKKFLSLKNITHLNRNYSTKMKELGWNVKDFELYEDMTPEEKEEHKKNKKNYGRDSLQFKKEEKQKLEKEVNNLNNLKKEIVKNLTKDQEVRNLAINRVKQELKQDETIQNKVVNQIIDNMEIDEIKKIEKEQKEIFKSDLRNYYAKDEKLQEEAKIEAKNKLLDENFNKMSFTEQETIKHYKKVAIDIGKYNNELEKNIDKLLFKNNIFKKILKFVSYFLPCQIQNKLNQWVSIDEMSEVSENEINKNIFQYVEEIEEQSNIEESEEI